MAADDEADTLTPPRRHLRQLRPARPELLSWHELRPPSRSRVNWEQTQELIDRDAVTVEIPLDLPTIEAPIDAAAFLVAFDASDSETSIDTAVLPQVVDENDDALGPASPRAPLDSPKPHQKAPTKQPPSRVQLAALRTVSLQRPQIERSRPRKTKVNQPDSRPEPPRHVETLLLHDSSYESCDLTIRHGDSLEQLIDEAIEPPFPNPARTAAPSPGPRSQTARVRAPQGPRRWQRLPRLLLGAGTLVALLGVQAFVLGKRGSEAPPPPLLVPVRFEVLSQTGEPVPSARISVAETPLGTTNKRGVLDAELPAEIPESLKLHCPEHHQPLRPPERLVLQALHGLDGQPLTTPVRLRCDSLRVAISLVVRAAGVEGLPVRVQGELVGETGPDGILNHRLHMPRWSALHVEVDTTSRPELRPSNPGRSFTVEDQDVSFVLETNFEAPRRPPRKPQKAPARKIPYRIE